MKKSLFVVQFLLLSLLFNSTARADFAYIYDCIGTVYLTGKEEAVLTKVYSNSSLVMDKEISYTGEWMMRFFGKVAEGRMTTLISLHDDTIKEVDYSREEVVIYPIEKFYDLGLADIKEFKKKELQNRDSVKERYVALLPKISITVAPNKEKVNGYACRKVEGVLQTETIDKIKNATSIRVVKQTAWLADSVSGYEGYKKFNAKLAKRLKIDVERLGALSPILRYWEGTLNPIRSELAKVQGFPIKTTIDVTVYYITETNTANPKKSSMLVRSETHTIREIKTIANGEAETKIFPPKFVFRTAQ
ncbi:MAG: hypothetical protein K9K75_04300 [Deltaproteobacteria bacterium]|nr:hypothetical protein [Deltaproteobacteria bacterium]